MNRFTRDKNKKPYLGYLIVRHGAGNQKDLQEKWKKETVCNMPDSWRREWDKTCSELRECMSGSRPEEKE